MKKEKSKKNSISELLEIQEEGELLDDLEAMPMIAPTLMKYKSDKLDFNLD